MLPGVALEALQVHRIQQEQIRVNMGEKWQDKGLVFCDGYGGFFSPDMVLRRFDKLLDEAGLPHMRFHDLRHSAATILLVASVHPKVVQERLGHSTIAMTLDVYSHVLPSMQQEAVDGVAMHFMLHLRFKGLVDLLSSGNFSPFGSCEKRLQKGLFLLDRQIFVMASAFG